MDATVTASPHDATLPSSDAGATRGAAVGRYLLLDPIGRGGGGVVFRAYDPELDRKVAIKLVHGDEHDRLLREAQALARLSHPNVVPVHDVGERAGGVFLAMELLDGVTVSQWLDQAPRSRAEILGVFAQAARGLQAAHDAGLVHRDVKPSNLMVGVDGRVRVVDFGLARGTGAPPSIAPGVPTGRDAGGAAPSRAAGPPSATPTHADVLEGTPAFLSPEQARLEPLTAASDQFSLCIALYQALWKVHPYDAATPMALVDAIADQPPREPPPGGPAALRRAVMRGLAREPTARHPSMAALADELDRLRGGRSWRLAAGGTAALVLVAVLGWQLARPAGATPCQGLDAPITAAWPAEARARLAAAFAGSGHPDGAAIAGRVAAALDARAAAWRAARVETCRATRVQGSQTPELMDRRMACLDSRARELATVLAVWTDAPTTRAVADALAVTSGLPPLADCDAARLLARPGEATDEATRAIRALLDEANALHVAGASDRAAERAQQALDRAPRDLRAEALFLAGQAAVGLGKYDVGEARLYEALAAAGQTGHDLVLAEALVRLVFVEGEKLGRFDEAIRIGQVAGAAVRRIGDPPGLAAELAHNEGSVLQRLRRLDESEARLRQAIALRRALGQPHRVAGVLQALGNTLEQADRLDEARAVLIEARDLLAQVGDDSGRLVRSGRNNLAIVLARLGDRAGAIEQWRAVHDEEARINGPDHPELIFPLANIAWASVEGGQLDAADDHARRGIELYQRAGLADHPFVGNLELVRSYVAVARRDGEAALVHLAASAQRLRPPAPDGGGAAAPPTDQDGQVLALRGDALALLGRAAEAEAAYREALAVYQAAKAGPAWQARPRLGLARLAWAKGDRAVAAEHVTAARALLADAPANFDLDRPVLAEVAAATGL